MKKPTNKNLKSPRKSSVYSWFYLPRKPGKNKPLNTTELLIYVVLLPFYFLVFIFSFRFRSIHTRIMTVTTLLIVAIVGSIVWAWGNNQTELYYLQKKIEAQSLATALSNSWTTQLENQNWSNIRIGFNLILKDNPNFIYIIASDVRLGNQIIAATPEDLQEQYFPDIVPVKVTEAAVAVFGEPVIQKTFILRDIEYPKNNIRAKRGQEVIEVASDIRTASGEKIGILRIGISLFSLYQAITNAANNALLVGVFGLFIGLIGAYLMANQLSHPVRRLQASAAKIAAGDLRHRADINLSDEIGALATSFNEMSAALQISFSKLQKTIESFQRFVPGKFLAVIASDGIENIQVGVASHRVITILFCDIRSYTSMSEQMTPIETFEFLNDYLSRMGNAIDNCGGFIDKYIGDAIMALFDRPHTDYAVQAALAMQNTLVDFNQDRRKKGLPTIDIGIGIHQGEVIMGTIGFTSRIDSTVIGDAVNLASRVEGLTKTYNCSILVTESVIAALAHPENFKFRLVDRSVKVKGKDESIAIYEIR